EPEERVTDEKIADLVPAEIKNERAPVLMFALARIGVLVEIGAVEFGKRMNVLRKMRGHPIHDHAEPGLMTAVDKMPKLVRISEATGRSVIIGDLISPRAFEGMLRDRQQLQVGVAH